jgi:hypothetical protein
VSEPEDDGARVVRARVRARVLGLPLLTVDARIDIGPPGSRPRAVVAAATNYRIPLPRPRPDDLGPLRGGLRRAERLLDEAARPA